LATEVLHLWARQVHFLFVNTNSRQNDMKLSLRSLSLATVAAATLAVAPAAYADTMYPIGSTAPTVVGGIGSPLSIVSNSVVTPTYTISYTAAVYRDTDAAGTLDFLYHITGLTATGSDAVTNLSISAFTPSELTSVEAVGTGQAPTSPADLGTNGVMNISFMGNPIGNNDSSQTLWLITDSTTYTFGTFTSQDASVATLSGYEPIAAPTPEPGTFALMGTGLLAAAGALRRRVKT
jgi:hypothetical protein